MSSRPSQIIGHKNQTASQGNYNPELSGIYVKGTSFFYTFVKITNAIFCHESNYLLFFLPAPIHLPSAPGDGRYGCCTKSQPVRKNIQTFLFRPGRRYPSARRFQGSRMVPYHRRALLSLPYLQCIRSDQLPSWHRPDLFSPVLIQAGRHLSTKRKETYRYAFMRKPFYRPKALFY